MLHAVLRCAVLRLPVAPRQRCSVRVHSSAGCKTARLAVCVPLCPRLPRLDSTRSQGGAGYGLFRRRSMAASGKGVGRTDSLALAASQSMQRTATGR